jgi:hypothetical protein
MYQKEKPQLVLIGTWKFHSSYWSQTDRLSELINLIQII